MIPISVGLNHHKTPLELREKTAFSEDQLPDALANLRTQTQIDEAVIISTCNRCEIFSFCGKEKQEAISNWICQRCHIESSQLRNYWHNQHGKDAVCHLMRITCGLDSVIIGEPQILGQVKTAYQIAQQHQHTGVVLNRLFEYAFSTAKQIRSETDLGKHPISYASIILNISKMLFDHLSDRQILIIGVGEMPELVIQHFKEAGMRSITVVNRTHKHAEDLANKVHAKTENFDNLAKIIHRYDIIVSCTASKSFVLDKLTVEAALKRRHRKPLHISDLAVPRDIDPSINQLEDVYLYSLDNLAQMINANQNLRMAAGKEAEGLIAQGVDKFTDWLNTRASVSLLKQYRNHAELQCKQALEQALQQLHSGQPAKDVLHELAHCLSRKLMHPMTEVISNSGSSGSKQLLKMIEDILKHSTKP